MDLRSYLRILRKNAWLIALVAVLGLGGAFVYNAKATRIYEASVTFYVSIPGGAVRENPFQANQYALSKIDSYTRLLSSDALAAKVVQKSGLDMSVSAVRKAISASADLNTVLIRAEAQDSSSARALAITQAMATEFGPLVDQLGDSGTVKMNVVSGPSLNPFPVSPSTKLNLGLGLFAGLLAGFVLAMLRGLLDTTIRSVEALRNAVPVPVLGSLTVDSSARKDPVLIGPQRTSVLAESFRHIRTSLQFMDVDNPVQVLVVTSSVAGEGKSSTATNLAAAYAEAGRRVLLIEGDLRRGKLDEYLGLEGAVGLSNVLAGTADVDDVLQPWGEGVLTVLLGGEVPPNPSELLGSHQMVELIEAMRQRFDFIVVDTPPLLPVTDAAVASTWADGVLLVVRYGKTGRTQLATAVRALTAVDARILGTVLSLRPVRGGQPKEVMAYGSIPKTDKRSWRPGKKAERAGDAVSEVDAAKVADEVVAPTKPASTKPAAAESGSTKPAAAQPAAAQPASTRPAAVESPSTEPAAAQPARSPSAASLPAPAAAAIDEHPTVVMPVVKNSSEAGAGEKTFDLFQRAPALDETTPADGAADTAAAEAALLAGWIPAAPVPQDDATARIAKK